MLQRLFQNTL